MGDSLRGYEIPNYNSVGQITIPTEEYRNLVKIWAATEAFVDFVKKSKYSIDKDDCARFLGFKLQEDENAGN